jgi:hypothetical protein
MFLTHLFASSPIISHMIIDPYYLPSLVLLAAINSDLDRLREFLHAKIAKRKKQIHPEHSARFNHGMQLLID